MDNLEDSLGMEWNGLDRNAVAMDVYEMIHSDV